MLAAYKNGRLVGVRQQDRGGRNSGPGNAGRECDRKPLRRLAICWSQLSTKETDDHRDNSADGRQRRRKHDQVQTWRFSAQTSRNAVPCWRRR